MNLFNASLPALHGTSKSDPSAEFHRTHLSPGFIQLPPPHPAKIITNIRNSNNYIIFLYYLSYRRIIDAVIRIEVIMLTYLNIKSYMYEKFNAYCADVYQRRQLEEG